MHWKTIRKSVKAVFECYDYALRADDVYWRAVPGCTREDVIKALAALVKSGEVTCNRGWYRRAEKQAKKRGEK